MIRTDGVWDPADRPLVFAAAEVARRPDLWTPQSCVLLPVNNIVSRAGTIAPATRRDMNILVDSGARLLIDSGVFWLASQHAKHHDLPLRTALAFPPDELDGFSWLHDAYLLVHDTYRDYAWGFIEIDQGGQHTKQTTRAGLHRDGVAPIPVFHPATDTWEYFAELTATHDRVCVGNIVDASETERARLFAELDERKPPGVWLHLLGCSPTHLLHAFWRVADSIDASSWMSTTRWGHLRDYAMGRVHTAATHRFVCDDWLRAGLIPNDTAARNWRHWRNQLAALTPPTHHTFHVGDVDTHHTR